MISRARIVEVAREWVGTPFHHGGRAFGVGVDCIGLVVGVALQLGLPVRDRAAYSLRPDGTLRRELAGQLIPAREPQPGDVLLMAFETVPHHVAIYAGATIIHAHARARRVVEQPYGAYWQQRVRGVFSYPGASE